MEVWSSAEAGERVSRIEGAYGPWVGLQASVNYVRYIFVTHVHGGFGSGDITWFCHLAMLWVMGWATSISELYVMSQKCTYMVDLVLESLLG